MAGYSQRRMSDCEKEAVRPCKRPYALHKLDRLSRHIFLRRCIPACGNLRWIASESRW